MANFQNYDPADLLLSPRLTVTGGDPGSSLEGVNTSKLADGSLCVVQGTPNTVYQLQKSLTAGGIAPKAGPGRWFPLAAGGGGTVAPFTEVYYTDPGTAVLPADQTGSVAAPYITIQAAVNAAVAALQTTFSVIMTATTYPEALVVPSGVSVALVTEGIAILNSLQISTNASVFSGRGQIGVLTLILDGPTSQIVGYVATSLGTVTLNDQCVIRLTGEFAGGNVTAGVGDIGTLIYSCSDVNAEQVGINTSILGLINTPNMDVQVSGCLVERGITAKSGVFSHCLIIPDGDLTFAGKCEISDCQFGAVGAPYTITLSAQGAILKDCDFPGVGANLLIDNSAGLLALDPYTFERFYTSGFNVTTPANVAIIGQLTKRIAGAVFVVPALAAGAHVDVTIAAAGVQPIEQIVLNGTFAPLDDIFPAIANCTSINFVTVRFQTVLGFPGGPITLDIYHTFPTTP
jgi:hypothetical protein